MKYGELLLVFMIFIFKVRFFVFVGLLVLIVMIIRVYNFIVLWFSKF